MMKTKSILLLFISILCISFLFGVTGTVTLATEETSTIEETIQEKDKLIGVFVTKEYLNLFDINKYIVENAEKLTDETILNAEQTATYETRLYAKKSENATEKITFDGIEGFLHYFTKKEDTYGSYTSHYCDKGISNGHMDIKNSDNDSHIFLDGTIYLSTQGSIHGLYYNPVYQTTNGEIYVLSGTGHFYESELNTEGLSNTVTFEDTRSYTKEDNTIEEYTKITLSCEYEHKSTCIVLTQMNNNYQIVKQQNYAPEKMPNEIILEDKTCYLIVETIKMDLNGNDVHSYELLQPNDTFFFSISYQEDGIGIQNMTTLQWQQK